MKLLVLCCIAAVICLDAFGVASQKTFSTPAVAYQSTDISILNPADVAYAEAMEFARFMSGKGIVVKSVHGSKLNGFFQGLRKAAFFRTDKGVVEVIFFPAPSGAERVRVKEQRRGGKYLYSFEGQPHPNPPGDTINAGQPIYFLMHRNWFIVTGSEELYGGLRRALTAESSSNK